MGKKRGKDKGSREEEEFDFSGNHFTDVYFCFGKIIVKRNYLRDVAHPNIHLSSCCMCLSTKGYQEEFLNQLPN